MKSIFLCLTLFLSLISFSQAQVNTSLSNQEALIEIEPRFPEPASTFKATINDYSLVSQVSTISWRVNNSPVPESNNQRTINLIAAKAGSKTIIEADIVLINGLKKTISQIVTPLYLDIIVEPQTRTPAFYIGRALPSLGSTVNLTAIVNGISVSQNDLIYTWRVNNSVIEGGSLRGKNRVSVSIPYGQLIIFSVDVASLNGDIIAKKYVEVPSVSPSVYFYESNSLYGLSNKMIGTLSLVGESAVVQAEPYNLDIQTYNSPDLLEWEVDNNKSKPSSGNPYQVTLARPEGSYTGISNINFHVRNLSQILQGVKGDFKVNF